MNTNLNAARGMAPPLAPTDLVARHLREAAGLQRRTGWLLALGVLPVLGWLALAPLASAVVASGHVKVDLNRRTVQHAEGGTVRHVYVRDGQRVRAGEPLMELGDVAVSADKSRLGYRLLSEQAGVIRLDAEALRADALVWPPALVAAAKTDAALGEQLRKEQALFQARRDALLSQTALLQQQRERIGQEKVLLMAQIGLSMESIGAQRRELDTNTALAKDGFIAATRIMQLESTVADYGARLEERRSELVRADQRMADIDLRQRGLEGDYRQQASDQLKVAAVRVQEIEQELRKATDASARQLIVAPVDGEVIGLRVTHAGAVIAPREPVAEVVPTDPQLVVEARIRPEDINRVHGGQTARLRLTAYQSRTTPWVVGTVSYVSGDRLVEAQTQQAYYAVSIRVDSDAVAAATHGEKLQAGMPAEVYLDGAERTPLQYLLEPVTQVLRRAGRER